MSDARLNQGAPERSQILEALIDAVGIDLRGAMPGNITKIVGRSPARVDVQTGIGRADRASTDADRYDSTVRDVLVAYQLCGDGGLSFDLAVGDAVLLVFCDRSIVEWIAGGGSGKVPAADARTHDLTDAIAFPIRVGALDSTGGLRLGWLGSSIEMGASDATTIDATTIEFEATLGKLGGSALDGIIKGTGALADLALVGALIATWLSKLTPIIGEWAGFAAVPLPWIPNTSTVGEFSTAHGLLVTGWGTFLSNMATRISLKWKVE